MPFRDIEKRRIYRREWYKRNSISEINHVTRRKKEIRKWILEYKSRLKCSICGESHPAIIDFHHNGKKENLVSTMILNGNSREKILGEISKCQVLCANCHRKLHFHERKL